MDDYTSPWETLINRIFTKDMADSIEGDLPMYEFQEALFEHMNVSSSPDIDGFTVTLLKSLLD